MVYGGAALAALLIVFFVSSAPLLAFRAQDEMLFNTPHERQKIDSRLSPEAEEIYLVRAIHNYYSHSLSNGYFYDQGQIRTLDEVDARALFNGQLGQLEKAGVFEPELAARIRTELTGKWAGRIPVDQNTGRFAINSWEKLIQMEENSVFWVPAQETAIDSRGIMAIQRLYPAAAEGDGEEAPADGLMLLLEPKTQKALSIYFGVGPGQKTEEQNRKITEDYIHYLGLDVIDDWHWEGEGAEAVYLSTKARLCANAPQQNGGPYLSVIPLGAPEEGTIKPEKNALDKLDKITAK